MGVVKRIREPKLFNTDMLDSRLYQEFNNRLIFIHIALFPR